MKQLVLTVFTVLLSMGLWAQPSGKPSACSIQIGHQIFAPSCQNGLDGKILLTISGARKPYNIQWSDQGAGAERTGLAAGLYIVTVSDAEGCVKKMELQLPQGKAIGGQLAIQPAATGVASAVTVLFADGSKPYLVKIKNLSQGVRAPWSDYKGEVLKKGVYVVEAFTRAGCSQVGKIDLSAL